MKALLRKDYLAAFRQLKYFLVFILAFIMFQHAGVQILAQVYTVILCINSITMEEQSGWRLQAAAMPLDRRTLVLEKYLLCYLNLGCVALALLPSIGIGRLLGFGAMTGFAVIPVGLCTGLAAIAVLLPMNFFFGATKGRYIMLIVIGGSCGLFAGLRDTVDIRQIAERMERFISLLPAVVAVLNLVSIPLSMKFYGRHLK